MWLAKILGFLLNCLPLDYTDTLLLIILFLQPDLILYVLFKQMSVDWQTMLLLLFFLVRLGTNYLLWQWIISQMKYVGMCGWGCRIGPFLLWWRTAGEVVPGGSVQGLGIESFPTSHMLWVGVSSPGPLARLLLCCFPLPRPLGPPLLPLLLFQSRGRWLTGPLL